MRGERLDRARFEYLRQVFGRIERAVRDVDRSPWTRLEREIRHVPVGNVGGTTCQTDCTLNWAICSKLFALVDIGVHCFGRPEDATPPMCWPGP